MSEPHIIEKNGVYASIGAYDRTETYDSRVWRPVAIASAYSLVALATAAAIWILAVALR